MPELRQLRAFVAVADEPNFTRAAERLHLGQQAVSKSVGQLERELGVALLERTTREVRLTPAGTTLLESGRDALAAADAAFDRARTVGRGLAGTVRVGVTPAIGPATRDEVARVLRDGAAELSVSFHEFRPGEVSQRLRDRTVDLVPPARTGTRRTSTALRCVPPRSSSSFRAATGSRTRRLHGSRSSTASASSPGARPARRAPTCSWPDSGRPARASSRSSRASRAAARRRTSPRPAPSR